MLSSESPLYDPVGYNQGAVWPFVTGFLGWAHYRYRRPWAGFPLLDALRQMTFDWSRGRHHEIFSGAFYQPLEQSVPHQAWSSAALATVYVRGLIGWEPNAPMGRARLAPQPPPNWERALSAHDLKVGATVVALTMERRNMGVRTALIVDIDAQGPVIDLDLVPPLPPGAHDVSARVDGSDMMLPADGIVHLPVGEGRRTRIEVGWRGGLDVIPPPIDLRPGQASTGLRILDFDYLAEEEDAGGSEDWRQGERWRLILEGRAGDGYTLMFVGEPIEAVVVEGTATVVTHSPCIAIQFPPGRGSATAVVDLVANRSGPRQLPDGAPVPEDRLAASSRCY